MNKLIKLIYVNILKLFDFNKVVNFHKKNIKSNSEIKLIFMGVIALLGGYLLYTLYMNFNISVSNVLVYGFILSTILSFLVNFKNVNDLLFYDNDTEYLFSLPISTKHIVFSKLFSIYIKNIVYVIVVIVASLIAYYGKGGSLDDTLGLMLIISTLFIPLVPIVVITFLSYIYNLFKVRCNSLIFNVIKLLVIIVILLMLYTIRNFNVMKLAYYIYPFLYLFKVMYSNTSMVAFILIILFNILVIYLYMLLMSDNYMKIVSNLKGVKKTGHKYSYRKVNNGKFIGTIKKEMIMVINNHKYFFNIYGGSILFSALLLVVWLFNISVDIDENIIKVFGPALLAMLPCFSVFTISSISMEREHLQVIRTMPVGFNKYLLAKVFSNLILSTIFVVINGICYSFIFDRHGFDMVISFVLPFSALLFDIVLCLLLDLRFPVKRVNNESEIINSRILNVVPAIVGMFVCVLPMLFKFLSEYNIVLLGYVAILLLGTNICIIDYIIKRKKIMDNLFS